jgi:hypothetical protein
MNPRVKEVKYHKDYKLIITFLNSEVKEFDISPYLIFPVYEELKDENLCREVKVFNGTIIWNEVIDFDPDTLYLESKSLVIT